MQKKAYYSDQVLWEGALRPATVLVEGSKIVSVHAGKVAEEDIVLEDFGNAVLMPGLIDAHVHINEPGRTEWEGFATATQAAAAGGICTLVDMPLNSSPVSTTAAAFSEKLAATKGQLHVNCGFWGGLVPENIADLEELLDAGVLGLKAFLTHSGIDDFPNVVEADLHKALPILKAKNSVLLVHCEIEKAHAAQTVLANYPRSYSAYLQSRPKSWEDEAIALMIRLCETYEVPIHIVHLSSANALEMIRAAKAKGLALTVETCPQYLYFSAEQIPDGATAFKCAPPIREARNNEKLWQALQTGLIDFIATDHSPAPPAIKVLDTGNFKTAWGGIASLQFSLPAMWTKARGEGATVLDICQWMSAKVASFLSLQQRKGKIAPGYDADLVVWDPEATFVVKEEAIFHRHKVTPYLGETLYGVVQTTVVNGRKVFENGKIVNPNCGELILK